MKLVKQDKNVLRILGCLIMCFTFLKPLNGDVSNFSFNDVLNNIKKENSTYTPKGVTDADRDLDDINFVHYDLENNELHYEDFDINHFTARTSCLNSRSLANSNSIYETVDEDSDFLNGYDPITKRDSSSVGPNRSVIGGDTRTRVLNPKSGDYLKICYLDRTNPLTNFEYWGGTGFLVGPNLVLTAAHCVYKDSTDDDIDNGLFYKNLKFYFGIENGAEHQQGENYQYYAKAKTVTIEYSYYLKPNSDHDWALIELDRDIGNQIGWFGITKNYYNEEFTIKSYGYPSDKPIYSMWEGNGNFISDNGYRYAHNIDTYGGQSGSPLIMTYANSYDYVCGVHTSGGSNSNGGTKINTLIYYYINSYFYNRNNNRDYFYIRFDNLSKSGTTWNLDLVSKESRYITAYYNKKMCFDSDAANWSNLHDVDEIRIAPYGRIRVSIKENWFANSIVTSYIDHNYQRIVSYARGLTTSGSFDFYFGEIQL